MLLRGTLLRISRSMPLNQSDDGVLKRQGGKYRKWLKVISKIISFI